MLSGHCVVHRIPTGISLQLLFPLFLQQEDEVDTSAHEALQGTSVTSVGRGLASVSAVGFLSMNCRNVFLVKRLPGTSPEFIFSFFLLHLGSVPNHTQSLCPPLSHLCHSYAQIDSRSPIFLSQAGCMEISSAIPTQHLSLFHPQHLPTESWIGGWESGRSTQLLLFPCSMEVAVVLHRGNWWGKQLEGLAEMALMCQITKGWATQRQQRCRI